MIGKGLWFLGHKKSISKWFNLITLKKGLSSTPLPPFDTSIDNILSLIKVLPPPPFIRLYILYIYCDDACRFLRQLISFWRENYKESSTTCFAKPYSSIHISYYCCVIFSFFILTITIYAAIKLYEWPGCLERSVDSPSPIVSFIEIKA